MTIINGKIAECTEMELYDYYLQRELDKCGIQFYEFLNACELQGTKVIKDIIERSVCMIKYTEFERYIKKIMDEWDYIDKCESIGFNIYEHAHGIDCTIELIEKNFEDEEHWLSWWAFEKNFGRDNKYDATDDYGNVLPTDTIKDIYNILVENMINKHSKK